MKWKNEKTVISLLLVVFVGVIVLIYTYPRSMANFVEPLKNGEELEYIRIMRPHDDPYIVEITDQETIALLKEQVEKVRVRYIRNAYMIPYSVENYVLTMDFNHSDQRIDVQKDGTVYWDDKQYIPVDDQSLILFNLLEELSLNEKEK
mgnify:CR=1 FL=1